MVGSIEFSPFIQDSALMWKRNTSTEPVSSGHERDAITPRSGDELVPIGPEEALPLSANEKAYAGYLMRKSGIDFQRFRQPELTDNVGGLLSPLDHLLAFLCGAVPGFLFSIAIWYFFFFDLSENVRGLMFVLACLFGMAFGGLLGAIVALIRSFRNFGKIIEHGIIAVRSVRDESKNVGVTALKRLSSDDIATGLTWIVLVPAVEITLRKRLKVALLSTPAIAVLKRVLNRLFPLRVPADAETQIAALPPLDASAQETSSAALERWSKDPLHQKQKSPEGKDWVEHLERTQPKVLRVTRKTRNAVVIPLVTMALCVLVVMVGGAALVAHFLH